MDKKDYIKFYSHYLSEYYNIPEERSIYTPEILDVIDKYTKWSQVRILSGVLEDNPIISQKPLGKSGGFVFIIISHTLSNITKNGT